MAGIVPVKINIPTDNYSVFILNKAAGNTPGCSLINSQLPVPYRRLSLLKSLSIC
ncbi:MAG: hypothetical protein OFPI_18510 [Osedax symbiont Rs2]|nr:MAG: hypothetical protein OFPI_18510 [Osedax symbiont Rs2]